MVEVFSGLESLELSQKTAKLLHIKLSAAQIIRFPNSELRVRIDSDVKNKSCAVIQSTSSPSDSNLIELLFFADALKGSGAKKIVAVIPYFGYSRQNKADKGECSSLSVVLKLLEAVGISKIITFDIHNIQSVKKSPLPIANLSALELLANKVKSSLGSEKLKNITIVSPDRGGEQRAKNFGKLLFQSDNFTIAVVEKERKKNVINSSRATNLKGNVKGKRIIIVDDIITSGATIRHAADICLSRGAINISAAVVVHHDLIGSASSNILGGKIARIFTTDTIAMAFNQKDLPNMEELSVAPIIASELTRI